MSDCIFCKIIAQEIPCHKIYEDEYLLAFLDINPVSYGHTLIIPKKHAENILDVWNDDLTRIITLSQSISLDVVTKLWATGVNIVNASGKDAQQSVEHLHFHVVPRYPNDGIDIWFHGKGESYDFTEIKNKLTQK